MLSYTYVPAQRGKFSTWGEAFYFYIPACLIIVLFISGLSSRTAAQDYGLRFNGTNQFISTSLDAQPSAIPTTTWEAWIKPANISKGTWQTVFATDDGGYDRGVWIPGDNRIIIGYGTEGWVPAVTLVANTWYHIAVIYKPDNVLFYFNGTEYSLGQAPSGQATTQPFSIGACQFGPSAFFEGDIDEVRVWNTARSQAQIQASMNTELTGSESNLTAYYKMNEGSGTTTADNSGHSYTGTLNNTPSWVTGKLLNPAGSGTSGSPYLIGSLNQLKWISDNSSVWASYFKQIANIDASATQSWNSGAGWSPIGNNTNAFTGNYNGQGHTISGLFISRTDDYQGLFGQLSSAVIQNLGLINVSISGRWGVGAIAGGNGGTGTISNCYSTGTITAGGYGGGICGESGNGAITQCYSLCRINCVTSANPNYFGGLIGRNNGAAVTYTYSLGKVTGSGNYKGGLVGYNNGGSVTHSFWNSDSNSTSDGGTSKTSVEMKSYYTFYDDGWDFLNETANGSNNFWGINETGAENNGYPFIQWQGYSHIARANVTTQAVSDISYYTATGNGNAVNLGSPNPTQYGVCWSTAASPTTGDNKTSQGALSSTGAFTSSISGLTPGITYYVRAYVTNTMGTVYGEQVQFASSASAPSVTTQSVTNITSATATGNGTITDLGVPNPTQYGVCWSTSANPTIDLPTKTQQGEKSTTGAFTSNITGLAQGITYYVRAYATNVAGTSYGNQVEFRTSEVAGVDYAVSFNGTNQYADCGNVVVTGANPRTIEAWVYTRTFNFGGIWQMGYQTGLNEFSLRTWNADNQWLLQFWGGDISVTLPGSKNSWNHLAMVYDGTNVKLYFNGTLFVNQPKTLNTLTGTFCIGKWGSEYFDGIVDEVRVWNTARSQSEINASMFGQLTGSESGLIAYYKMNHGSGSAIDDYSPNTFTGTLINSPSWVSGAFLPSGSGASGNPYLIANINHLKWIADNSSVWGAGVYFNQTANINAAPTFRMNSGQGWTPIGSSYTNFLGTYDGKGFLIDSLNISRQYTSDVGLFGHNYNAALQDIHLTNAQISGSTNTGGLMGYGQGGTINLCSVSGSINGYNSVGGLAGYCYNVNISNCSSSGTVTGSQNSIGGLIGNFRGASISNCSSHCTVNGNQIVGGLSGYSSDAAISNSFSKGTITGTSYYVGGLVGTAYETTISSCYSSGSVSGTEENGGLVGRFSGWRAISNCYSLASVTSSQSVGGAVGANIDGASVANSYCVGRITASGSSYIGGFIGYNYGEISGCYWDAQTSNQASGAYGGVGRNTASLKNTSNFSGWDFAGSIWARDDNKNGGYPYLSWQTFPYTVTITNGSAFSFAPAKGQTNQPIGCFALHADASGAAFDAVWIKLDGTRTGASNFKLWESADNTFNSGSDTQIGLTFAADPGAGNNIWFTGINRQISPTDKYYFLTCDIASNATGAIQPVIAGNKDLMIDFGMVGTTISNAPLNGSQAQLPVELISFTSKVVKNSVKLSWHTAQEITNYGFEVERQRLHGDWNKISFLEGAGNSNVPRSYSFIDKNVLCGKYLYRLKQIDADGSYKYSDAIEVSIDKPTKYALEQNYPNPFNPVTNIVYQLPKSGLVQLKVYDIVGNEVAVLVNETKSEGIYSYSFDAGSLPSGVYICSLRVNDFTQNNKMTLLK